MLYSHPGPTPHAGPNQGIGQKESHESHRPNKAPSSQSGIGPPGHRHAPPPQSLSAHNPPFNSHYKRCSKAERLSLRSDQSTSRSQHGRFPDKKRLTLSKGHCQVRAPLTRRIRFASSGDAPEHSVMSPPWAIAPPPDSPGLDLAGESEQSDERRLKTNAPFTDSTVVTIGDLRSTNAGLGSTLPSLRMVEHFWWTRLPHSETSSRLLHILSEVRGCRRVVADVKRPQGRTPRIATGVDAFSRNRPGPSIPHPFLLSQHSGPFTPSFLRRQSLALRRQESIPGGGAGALPPVGTTGWLPCGEAPYHHPRKAPSISARPRREKPGFPQNNQKSRLSPRIN